MAQIIRKIRPWSPPHPQITWAILFVLVFASTAPFVIGVALSIFHEFHYSKLSENFAFQELISTTRNSLTQAIASALIVLIFAPIWAYLLIFVPHFQLQISKILRLTSFCLPSIVIASGLIIVWGNQGVATKFLANFGISTHMNELLYSPYAVIIANVLMNLPLASISIYKSFHSINFEQIQSIKLLNLSKISILKSIIWPVIKRPLSLSVLLTFFLSLNSFGALSILGGTPESQTLELAIYQKLYFEGEWFQASIFALSHAILAATIAIFLFHPHLVKFDSNHIKQITELETNKEFVSIWKTSKTQNIFISVVSFTIDIFLSLPFVVILFQGIFYLFESLETTSIHTLHTNQIIFLSLKNSLRIALPAATIASLATWLITKSFCRYYFQGQYFFAKLILILVMITSIIPSMSSAFGILVIQTKYDSLNKIVAIIILHTAMIIPLLLNLSIDWYGKSIGPYLPSKSLLGLSDVKWFSKIEWTCAYKTIPLSFALGICLSICETSIVTMLSDSDKPTLTTTMIQLMGNYRFRDSALGSSLLILCTLSSIAIFTLHKGTPNANARIE